MTLKSTLLMFVALVAGATIAFFLIQRQLAGAWFSLGVNPEVIAAIESGLEDQKTLAQVDRTAASAYRSRFDDLQKLSNRLRILGHARERIEGRFELLLATVSVGLILAGVLVSVSRRRRDEARLRHLQGALEALSSGRTGTLVGERSRDLIGRIGRMVDRTAQVMARDRRRLRALRNLSDWQEATRRHAHEMRTPLTAARLELDRMRMLSTTDHETHETVASLAEELDRLEDFARGFATFARLPRPQTEPADLGALTDEFVTTFAAAWPNLTLSASRECRGELAVDVDRDLLRQVLVNLCDNAARAVADARGEGTLRLVLRTSSGGALDAATLAGDVDEIWLDVIDDGGGIDDAVQDRLFTPYVTAHRLRGGSGLGLAISKKILLDHGGDLELVMTGSSGTAFRLSLPRRGAVGHRAPDRAAGLKLSTPETSE